MSLTSRVVGIGILVAVAVYYAFKMTQEEAEEVPVRVFLFWGAVLWGISLLFGSVRDLLWLTPRPPYMPLQMAGWALVIISAIALLKRSVFSNKPDE